MGRLVEEVFEALAVAAVVAGVYGIAGWAVASVVAGVIVILAVELRDGGGR